MPKTENIDNSDGDIVKRWAQYPIEFIDFMFPNLKLTNQQSNALEELGKLVRAKFLRSQGKALTEEENRYASKIGLSIMSGMGTGKDTMAALIILWANYCLPDCKNIATANNAKQLRNVLWSEIGKWMRREARKREGSKFTMLEEVLELQSEKLFYREFKGETWFTESVTVNTKLSDEEQAEGIAGRHEDFQLIVVDEASGISNAVFKNFERTLTRAMNLMVIIFNPKRTGGYAIESQSDPRFISLRWNAEESELVEQDHIRSQAERYGKENNDYRISVLGLPPIVDESTLIPPDWIEDAVDRDITVSENDLLIKSMDCGAGGDSSVICTRRGMQVYPLNRMKSPESSVLINWACNDIDAQRPDVFRVDTVGIGWAVEGTLREKRGFIIEAADCRRTADNPERFANKRAEMFWNLRDAFERGVISIPDDLRLIKQLRTLRSKYNDKGKLQIIEKAKLKPELGYSPDEVDALALNFFKADSFVSKGGKGYEWKPPRYINVTRTSWMGN
ncbi:MAG: hypothetical protein WC208_15900 [Gallionella sp.]|jgi:hypothetical protein